MLIKIINYNGIFNFFTARYMTVNKEIFGKVKNTINNKRWIIYIYDLFVTL